MARRPLTHAEALQTWRVDGELSGGHSPGQTIGFVGALMDLEDDRERMRALPALAISPDAEPFGRLRRWLGLGG